MAKSTLTSLHDSMLSVEDLYTLSVTALADKTNIVMQLLIPQVSTRDFPHTFQFLRLYLPSILASTCYNDDKLPFHKEVTCTEVGHLFEHILLEFLCLLKMERGFEDASYEGVTDWNWIKDPKGTFHITIYTNNKETELFNEALEKTMALINTILSTEASFQSSLPLPKQTVKH